MRSSLSSSSSKTVRVARHIRLGPHLIESSHHAAWEEDQEGFTPPKLHLDFGAKQPVLDPSDGTVASKLKGAQHIGLDEADRRLLATTPVSPEATAMCQKPTGAKTPLEVCLLLQLENSLNVPGSQLLEEAAGAPAMVEMLDSTGNSTHLYGIPHRLAEVGGAHVPPHVPPHVPSHQCLLTAAPGC